MDKANSLLEGLFESSDAKGWDLHWDGGARQSIFRALVEIDAKQWRPKALACLVDDYIGESRYPSSLIWNLPEIVDILFEDKDVLPIWKEIKEHAYLLDAFEQGAEKPPALYLTAYDEASPPASFPAEAATYRPSTTEGST